MKLKKYLDFLFPINESAIVYSDKLKQILKKIDSPVATRLLEIEGEGEAAVEEPIVEEEEEDER